MGRREYKIIRADGSSKIYLVFSQLLKEFDREDLENLWRLVKAKHGNTRPEEAYERVLWGDMKVMFEPDIEISAAGTKVNAAERLQLLEEFLLSKG
ncbi:hypothetical protein Tco_0811390 [Tanacetum coccineum]